MGLAVLSAKRSDRVAIAIGSFCALAPIMLPAMYRATKNTRAALIEEGFMQQTSTHKR